MYKIDIIPWVETWDSFITLLSSLILAAITAWLAWLTKKMAASAKEAATQSRIAAQASLASVAAAEASVDVRFDVEPYLSSTAGKMRKALEILLEGGLKSGAPVTPGLLEKISAWNKVKLTCRGATVTVHALTVTKVVTSERSDPGSKIQKTNTTHQDIELRCLDELPRLCHANETIEFTVPDRTEDEGLVEFTATLAYSFGAGSVRQREVKWRKPREVKSGPGKEEPGR